LGGYTLGAKMSSNFQRHTEGIFASIYHHFGGVEQCHFPVG